jgi:transcriptional regulator with XRE-family HTH domain
MMAGNQASKPARPTPDTLRRLYEDHALSLREIGQRYGCAPSTVSRWMEGYGLTRRRQGRPKNAP